MVVDLNHSSRLESYHRKNEMNDRERVERKRGRSRVLPSNLSKTPILAHANTENWQRKDSNYCRKCLNFIVKFSKSDTDSFRYNVRHGP